MQEVMSSQTEPVGANTNDSITGPSESHAPLITAPASAGAQDQQTLTLFWVKDKDVPVDLHTLPSDTSQEFYTFLRSRALAQRNAAATGNCPYDLDVLYQFWSHFLIRNFNSQMYHEFKLLAAEDASQRHNVTGLANLRKYYSEALLSQISIRDDVARDYAALINQERKAEQSGWEQLKQTWNSASINLKNRKKVAEYIDPVPKAELDN